MMLRILLLVLLLSQVEGADARLRVCQLLNKLLKYMGEEACIDDDLYNKIYDGMLERLKDKVWTNPRTFHHDLMPSI